MQKFSEYINEIQDKIDKYFKKYKKDIIKGITDAGIDDEEDIIQAAKDDMGEFFSDISPVSSKEKSWFGKDSFEEAEDYFYDKIEDFAAIIAKAN